MSVWYKRVELAANVAIILVALLLGAVLVRRYLLPNQPSQAAPERSYIKPGAKLALPGVEWGASRRTLLIVLSADCRYCTESAPFYRRLAQAKAERGEARLLAVLPQSTEESMKYLGTHDIKVDEVKQAALGSINVRGTPTLVLVDNEGVTQEVWVGKLPPEREEEVLSRL